MLGYVDVTIASGVLTLTGPGHYRVETEGGAATDEITSITGVSDLDIFTLYPKTSGHWWTLQHNPAGNLWLQMQGDFEVRHMQDFITLQGIGPNQVREFTRGRF